MSANLATQATDDGLAHAEPLRDGRIYVSVWLMLMVATLARLQVDGAWLGDIAGLIFWGVLFGLGLAAGYRHARQPQPLFKKLSDASAVAGLMALLLHLGSGLTQGLLLLLTWMQLAKCFTLAQRRDLFFTLLVSFVLLLFAASRSKSTLFLILIAGYTLAGVYTLLLAHADRRRNLATGHQTATGGGNPFPASSLFLTTAILVLAGALYLLVPRPPAAHLGAYPDNGGQDYRNAAWETEARQSGGAGTADAADATNQSSAPDAGTGREGDARSSKNTAEQYGGLEPSFDIESPGAGRFSNGIVMYLQAPHGLYLRGRVFDHFDGLRWRLSARREHKLALERGYVDLLDGTSAAEGETIRQIIEIAADTGDVLVAAPSVARLGFPGPVIARDQEGSLRAPRPLTAGTRYEATSRQRLVAGRPTQASQGTPDARRYLQLPENLDPRITDLARRVTAQAGSPLEAAALLESHLRQSYHYSFETVFSSQNVTPLAEFLFETRRGHCEYFASAMTIMLRAIDIPARLATGYSATTYNPVTGYYEVRRLDGHAWTEAYSPGQGWVSFEPTAFYDLPQPAPATVAAALDRYIDRLAQIDQATRRPGESGSLADTWREIWRMVRDGGLHLARLLSDWLERHLPLLVGLLVTTTLVGTGAYRLRRALRDRLALWRVGRGPGRDGTTYLALCYREAEAWLARRGLPRDAADTLEEYADKVGRAHPTLAQGFRRLARQHGQACYGGHAPDDKALRSASAVFDEIVRSAQPAP